MLVAGQRQFQAKNLTLTSALCYHKPYFTKRGEPLNGFYAKIATGKIHHAVTLADDALRHAYIAAIDVTDRTYREIRDELVGHDPSQSPFFSELDSKLAEWERTPKPGLKPIELLHRSLSLYNAILGDVLRMLNERNGNGQLPSGQLDQSLISRDYDVRARS